MAEETPNTPESPQGSAAYTDEQLSEAFPGQDLAHVRSMLDKSAGVGVPADPHAKGEEDGTASAEPREPSEPTEPTVEYPEFIPEKFRKGSVEDAYKAMADAYSVLESAAGRARAGAGDGDSGDNNPASGEGAEDAGGTDPVDLRGLEAEYVQGGNKLSEEAYAKAEKAGLSRDVVDSYIAGQQAIANQLVTKVHGMVGGPDNYEALMQWMVGNMPPAEVEAYDEAVGTGKESHIAVAVRGAWAAYQAAVGTDTGRRVDTQTGTPADPAFKSKREMMDAMKDPRYAKDPAYRKDVERRLAGMKW